MKRKLTFLFIILSISIFNCNAINSTSSIESAQKEAIASNKLILVDFTAIWCGPCNRMDRESWSNDEIKEIMSDYIFLKIDIDRNKEVSNKYGVKGIPYIFILDPNGEVLYKSIGYKDKIELLQLLKKYALNIEYMQSENIENFKGKTSLTSIKLAEKYMDFTLLLDDVGVKNKFRNLAKTYLKISEKQVKKEKKIKNKIMQRSDLLSLYSKLLTGKYKKVIENLDNKFIESEVYQENNSLYNFLYYVSYNKMFDRDNAKRWYDKLKTNEDFTPYFLKSRKI